MLETIVGTVALFACIVLILFKIYNITMVLRRKDFFPKETIMFTLIGILICWGLYFLAFAGSLQYQESVAGPGGTYAITSNAYVQFAMFLPAMNFFLVLGIMLTVAEALAMYVHLHKRGWRQ